MCEKNRTLEELSLEFIYTIIDPLIADVFGLCATEFRENHSVIYDYVASALPRSSSSTLSKMTLKSLRST